MMFKTPRLPDATPPQDFGEAWQRLYKFLADVVEFLRITPVIEYKTITTVGNYPIRAKTNVSNVMEVRRIRTYQTKNSANVIEDTSIAWRPSDDPRQPGIMITALGGITQGTDYTVLLAIQGTG